MQKLLVYGAGPERRTRNRIGSDNANLVFHELQLARHILHVCLIAHLQVAQVMLKFALAILCSDYAHTNDD